MYFKLWPLRIVQAFIEYSRLICNMRCKRLANDNQNRTTIQDQVDILLDQGEDSVEMEYQYLFSNIHCPTSSFSDSNKEQWCRTIRLAQSKKHEADSKPQASQRKITDYLKW